MSDAQAGAVSLGAELIPGSSDQQLLERFVARNDQAAFGELLKRYGRTVWWVCRRILAQDQDAEDAFQAVFFVLARKAASIRKGEAVGSWLYGVAYRIAMRASKLANRRKKSEKEAAGAAEASPPWGRAACEEFQRLLDEEVERLAEKYRAPFVLCCLEGMSRSEAARELGWKEGTLSSRLAQARKLLQKRLVRRGVTLTSALTAVALGQQMASAAVPPALMQSTGEAMLTTDPGAAISPSAAEHARNYLRRTALTKIGLSLAVLLVWLFFLGGASVAAFQLRLATGADEAPAVIEPETFLPPAVALGTPVGEQVLTVAFSPDGKRLVTAGAWNTMPGQLKIWDVATGNELVALSRIPGVCSAAFSPDGRALATGDFSGAITVRDPITGMEHTSVKGHDIGVGGLAYSSNSELLASAGLDGTVKLWTAPDLQERKKLEGHADRVSSVAFFSHGRTLITGSLDRTAKIWDVQTGKEKFTLKGHASDIEAVAVSMDDKVVATASSDQTVRLWDAETGKETAVLGGQKDQAFFAVAFSPDGKFVAAAGRDGAIHLWDAKTRQSLGQLGKHTDAVWALAFSCDGVLASGSSDKTAKLWRPKGAGELATLKASWSATRPINALAYAPDGKVLAVATKDTTVHLRDAKSGDVAMVLPGHAGEVTCLAFAPDGQTLVSGSVDKTIKFWDRATGAEKRTLLPSPLRGRGVGGEGASHTGAVQALAFAPDGKKFASAGDDKMIRIWHAGSGKDLATLQGHDAPIRALAFAPDGNSIASGGADGTIRIWDLITKMEANSLQGHKGTVRALAFSSDGVLASAGEDTTVKLWDKSKAIPRFTLDGHTAAVLALAFSPKGRTLVSGSQDGTVRVWDPVNGQSRGILKRHKDAVTGLAIHPHGHNLVSGSHDTLLLRWQAGNSTIDGSHEITPAPKGENAPPKHLSRTSGKQEAAPNVQATPQPQAPTIMRRSWLLGAVAFGLLASFGIAVSLFVRSGLLPSAPRIWLTASALGVFFFAAVGIAGTVFLTPPQGGVSHLDKLLGTELTPGIEEEGFYATEVSSKSGSASRWTNGMAKMIIPLHGAAPKAVRVRLAIPSLRPVVNIRINGQSVFKERVAKDNWTETFDLTATKLGKELTLEILSDTVVPAAKNKNSTDERTLGVRVLGITLLSEAGFQKADKETFVAYGEGFFGQERNDVHTFRWMGDRLPKEAPVPIEGIVKLRNTRKDMFLKIVGDVPVYAMREPPMLKITFNGEVLDQFVPARRELDKFYKVPASKQSKAESSELRLTCSTFFIPAEYNKKSTDERRMCFRVFRLAWADKEEDLNTSEVPVAAAPVTPAAEPPNPVASNSGLRSWIWLVLLIGMFFAVALVLLLAAGILVAKRRAAKTAPSSIATNPPEDAVPFIAFACSECGKKLKTKSGMVGKKVKCSKCGKAVLVPPAKAGEK